MKLCFTIDNNLVASGQCAADMCRVSETRNLLVLLVPGLCFIIPATQGNKPAAECSHF